MVGVSALLAVAFCLAPCLAVLGVPASAGESFRPSRPLNAAAQPFHPAHRFAAHPGSQSSQLQHRLNAHAEDYIPIGKQESAPTSSTDLSEASNHLKAVLRIKSPDRQPAHQAHHGGINPEPASSAEKLHGKEPVVAEVRFARGRGSISLTVFHTKVKSKHRKSRFRLWSLLRKGRASARKVETSGSSPLLPEAHDEAFSPKLGRFSAKDVIALTSKSVKSPLPGAAKTMRWEKKTETDAPMPPPLEMQKMQPPAERVTELLANHQSLTHPSGSERFSSPESQKKVHLVKSKKDTKALAHATTPASNGEATDLLTTNAPARHVLVHEEHASLTRAPITVEDAGKTERVPKQRPQRRLAASKEMEQDRPPIGRPSYYEALSIEEVSSTAEDLAEAYRTHPSFLGSQTGVEKSKSAKRNAQRKAKKSKGENGQ